MHDVLRGWAHKSVNEGGKGVQAGRRVHRLQAMLGVYRAHAPTAHTVHTSTPGPPGPHKTACADCASPPDGLPRCPLMLTADNQLRCIAKGGIQQAPY